MAKKSITQQRERLFQENLVPAKPGSDALFEVSYDTDKPTKCLGLEFANDEARRNYFLGKLREKLKDPDFRNIDGFPLGEDEDILALSDPPYYTACPNPFLEEFVRLHGRPYESTTNDYSREPFAADVSEGKTDAIYNAHSYPTKVPPKAIARYILHYTSPGDVVYDGFCGTGMTGVAASLCGEPDSDFRRTLTDEAKAAASPKPLWGARYAIVSDLSPLATFIAHNYNTPLNVNDYRNALQVFFRDLDADCSSMYLTKHANGQLCRINYTVWSELFHCPNCTGQVVFLHEALDRKTGEVASEFPCPSCGTTVSKRSMSRVLETFQDLLNNTTARRVKRLPVFINYNSGGDTYEKAPDAEDMEVLRGLDSRPPKHFFPTLEMPYMHVTHIKDKMSNFGISHFSHFFLARPQHALAAMWNAVQGVSDARTRQALLFTAEQCIPGMSILNRYSPSHYSQSNRVMSGVYYVPSQHSEVSPWYILNGKSRRLVKVFEQLSKGGTVFVSLNSGADVGLPDNCIDYIFTDPPFGENLQYSELNWFVESFYRVLPNTKGEAVVNKAQRKGVQEYLGLMLSCMKENHRVLKPGRWITVEFHNSSNAIWNAIQEAILRAGFVVADVRTLDKQGETYKQSKQGVVKADLIISAYKPDASLEERFRLEAGSADFVWEFVRSHLSHLPVFISRENKVEIIAERQSYLLFDRMVAFHVQRGVSIPLSSSEFFAGLRQRFPAERDGMYFLPEQANEYDRRRLEVREIDQYELFVSDEKSGILWVRRQLSQKPMTYQDLSPLYMKEAQRVWEKHEQPLELRTILEQNFVEDDDGSWRIPDPNKEADLEQLRHKALMKEFLEYIHTKGRLKLIRTEAIRAGFKECWQKQDYATIVEMAKRVPEAVIQEDQALLMYFDNALMRTGD
jgi:DNA modification methylase